MTTIELILSGWVLVLHVILFMSVKANKSIEKQRDYWLQLSIDIVKDINDSRTAKDSDGFLAQRLKMRNKEIEEFINAE